MDSAAATSEFVSDAGPQFDPDAIDDAVDAPELADGTEAAGGGVPLEWDPAIVRDALELQGSLLHQAAGRGERDWIYTAQELRAIAPPLTRILNRYDTTRAAAAQADELAVLFGLGGYTIRSINESRRALAAGRPQRNASTPPPPGTPPEPPTASATPSSPIAMASVPPDPELETPDFGEVP